MNGVPQLMVAEGVSIYFNGQDEIRIRKGIWNYEEAILALGEADRHLRQALVGVFDLLDRGEMLDVDSFIRQEKHAPEVAAQIRQIIDTLRAQHYLQAEDDRAANLLLYDLLGGTIANRYVYGVQPLRPILFVGDTAAIKDHAARLAGEIGLPISVMTEGDFASITRLDLTTRFDGYTTHEQLDCVTKLIAPYAAIVGCMERPHVTLLRNLNRALIQTSTPLSLALLDGPFTSVFTIKPPETGCFECYELRLMARMQDIAAYRQFVDHTRGRTMEAAPKTYLTPLMYSLAAQVLFEGFLITSIGKAKLAGRLLNTYLPIMEIQVQDLLRVPFCPACGFVSKAHRDEMYTSTKKIVDQVLERVVIA
jgi:thiazole/oxazole-forming peptide maturase SagC family component